jgi:hypothetical protein
MKVTPCLPPSAGANIRPPLRNLLTAARAARPALPTVGAKPADG